MFKIIYLVSLIVCSYPTKDIDYQKGISESKGKSITGVEKSLEKIKIKNHNTTEVLEDQISNEDSTDNADIYGSSHSSGFHQHEDKYRRNKFYSGKKIRFGQWGVSTTFKPEAPYCTCCGRYFREDEEMAPGEKGPSQERGTKKITQNLNPYDKYDTFRHKCPDKSESNEDRDTDEEEVSLKNRKGSLPLKESDEAVYMEDDTGDFFIQQPDSAEDTSEPSIKNTMNYKLKNNGIQAYHNLKKATDHKVKEFPDLKLTKVHNPIEIQFNNTQRLDPLDILTTEASSEHFSSDEQTMDVTTDKSVHHVRIDSNAVFNVDIPVEGGEKKLRLQTKLQKQVLKLVDQSLWDGSAHDSKGQGSLILHSVDGQKGLDKIKETFARKKNKKGKLSSTKHDKTFESKCKNDQIVGKALNGKQNGKLKNVDTNKKDIEVVEDTAKSKEVEKDPQSACVKEVGGVLTVQDSSRVNKRDAQDQEYFSSSLFDTQPAYTYQESEHERGLPKREVEHSHTQKGMVRKQKKRHHGDLPSIQANYSEDTVYDDRYKDAPLNYIESDIISVPRQGSSPQDTDALNGALAIRIVERVLKVAQENGILSTLGYCNVNPSSLKEKFADPPLKLTNNALPNPNTGCFSTCSRLNEDLKNFLGILLCETVDYIPSFIGFRPPQTSYRQSLANRPLNDDLPMDSDQNIEGYGRPDLLKKQWSNDYTGVDRNAPYIPEVVSHEAYKDFPPSYHGAIPPMLPRYDLP